MEQHCTKLLHLLRLILGKDGDGSQSVILNTNYGVLHAKEALQLGSAVVLSYRVATGK